jgi:CRISPR-associated protein Csx10
MNSLFITLKLETPLLITGLGNGEENSSRSLSYIPGAALRGALISRCASDSNDLPLDPSGKLFFSGKVRFLNAYPLDQDGNRMLPIPASWRVEKGQDLKSAKVADLAIAPDQEKTNPIRKTYTGINTNKGLYAFSPGEEIAIHIASQGRGVVKAGESTVFQYQSLARGQRFCALILADDESDLSEIEKLLTPNILYLGRSRSAGYGKVLIEQFKRDDKAEVNSTHSQVTTITLLSDTILRDEHGQPTHDLDGYLTKRLKKTFKHQSAFIRPAETGGFNRKWKLPLPQMPALGMGSVFVYPAGQISASDLSDLVGKGIGERCVDGFGRIAVNLYGSETQEVSEATQDKKSPVTTTSHPLSAASQKVAKAMSERLLRHTLEQNLVTEVNKYTFKGNITNHQLARLRNVLRKSIDSKDNKFDEVTKFFSSLKETAKKQWHNSRLRQDDKLAGARLDLWMDDRVKKLDGLEFLKLDKETEFPKVAGLSVKLEDKLKREYTLRLMEAIVDHAMKANKEA